MQRDIRGKFRQLPEGIARYIDYPGVFVVKGVLCSVVDSLQPAGIASVRPLLFLPPVLLFRSPPGLYRLRVNKVDKAADSGGSNFRYIQGVRTYIPPEGRHGCAVCIAGALALRGCVTFRPVEKVQPEGRRTFVDLAGQVPRHVVHFHIFQGGVFQPGQGGIHFLN